MVAEVVPNGNALSRARELAELYLNAPEVTRRNTRIHFIQPLKERIVREVGYGLSLEGASSADLVKSMPTNREPVARDRQAVSEPVLNAVPQPRCVKPMHAQQLNRFLRQYDGAT